MTKTKEEPNWYAEFIDLAKKEAEFMELVGRAKDPREAISEPANKKIQEIIYKYGKEAGQFDSTAIPTPEALATDQEKFERASGYTQSRIQGVPANLFSSKLEGIVSGISEKTLETLANSKPIVEASDSFSEKEREVYSKFRNMQGLNDLLERYKSGKKISEDEEKVVATAAAKGAQAEAMKKEEERQNALGYGFVLKGLVALAGVGAATNTIRSFKKDTVNKYVDSGMKEMIKKAKEEYESVAEKNGKDVYAIVRDTIVKRGSDKKTTAEEFAELYRTVYSAQANKK